MFFSLLYPFLWKMSRDRKLIEMTKLQVLIGKEQKFWKYSGSGGKWRLFEDSFWIN